MLELTQSISCFVLSPRKRNSSPTLDIQATNKDLLTSQLICRSTFFTSEMPRQSFHLASVQIVYNFIYFILGHSYHNLQLFQKESVLCRSLKIIPIWVKRSRIFFVIQEWSSETCLLLSNLLMFSDKAYGDRRGMEMINFFLP